MNTFSDAAQKILEDRPPYWEYRLFARVLEDEFARARQRAELVGSASPRDEPLTKREEVEQWVLGSIGEVCTLPYRLPPVLASMQERAFGPPGVAGDPESIQAMAEEFALVLRECLEWKKTATATPVARRFRPVRTALIAMGDEIIEQITYLPDRVRNFLDEIAGTRPEPGTTTTLTLTIDAPGRGQLMAAMAKAWGVNVEEVVDDSSFDVDAFEAWYQDEIWSTEP